MNMVEKRCSDRSEQSPACAIEACDFFFFSSRRRHTRSKRDWSSDVCSSDLRHSSRQSTDSLSMYAAWQDLGLAYMKANRWTDAMNAFAELVRRQPNSVEAARSEERRVGI